MMASVASVPFSSSDSNQRSRIGRAAPVRISTASPVASPSCRKDRLSVISVRRSPSRGFRRSGGAIVRVGSTTAATRSSIASYCGYRSASRLLNFAISLRVDSPSGPKTFAMDAIGDGAVGVHGGATVGNGRR